MRKTGSSPPLNSVLVFSVSSVVKSRAPRSQAFRPITRSRPHCHVFSRSLHLDLAICAVLVLVGGIVTEQVLGSQFSGDGRERLRQRSNRVSAIELTAGSIGRGAALAALATRGVETSNPRARSAAVPTRLTRALSRAGSGAGNECASRLLRAPVR